MTTVLLSQLQFGHDNPGFSLNSRTTGRMDDVPELAASIFAKDLIEPLVIVWRQTEIGDEPFVVDGNRRLAAMRLLVEDGRWASPNEPVAVTVREESDAEAFETSVAANIERTSLHPVDRFEAFAVLAEQGRSAEDIATRFGLQEKEVARAMALGALAPEVRTAWREGEINESTAQAFALVADHPLQATTLKALQKSDSLYPHYIRAALGGEARRGELLLVGEEAYLAMGGKLKRDLFDERTYVLDTPTLKAMVMAMVQAELDDLTEDGWQWASLREDMPNESYGWARLRPEPVFTEEETARLSQIEAELAGDLKWEVRDALRYEASQINHAAALRAVSAEDKARAGVALVITAEGEFSHSWGWIKPESEIAADREEPESEEQVAEVEEGPGAEPASVIAALSEQRTLAFADVVAGDTTTALELLLATMMAGSHSGSPLILKADGAEAVAHYMESLVGDGADAGAIGDLTFGEYMAKMRLETTPGVRELVATMMASALDLTARAMDPKNAWGKSVTEEGVAALQGALDGDKLLAAMRRRFDPVTYFAGAKKDHALRAIEECQGEATAKSWGNRKKGLIAAFAAEAAAQAGWLPPLLRVPAYESPTPAAEAPAPEGEAISKSPLPKSMKDHLIVLGALDAVDEESARPFVIEEDGSATELSAGTVGGLIRRGLAAKITRKGPDGQRAAYHLTQAGADQYLLVLTAKA